jgi:hypothetical protein
MHDPSNSKTLRWEFVFAPRGISKQKTPGRTIAPGYFDVWQE